MKPKIQASWRFSEFSASIVSWTVWPADTVPQLDEEVLPMKASRKMTLFLILVAVGVQAPTVSHGGMSQSYQGTGNLGMEVTGVAGGNVSVASGTLTLTSNIPGGAQIVFATLYASQTNQGTSLDAVFAGNNLGSTGPTGVDVQQLGMYSYHWPITPQFIVPGVQSYSFTIGQGTLSAAPIAGVALAVVWQDGTEPTRTVTIMDGMQQVGELGAETETVSFTSSTPGATDIYVFTVNDDNLSSGETLTYNSTSIMGPLDRNLGFDASLLIRNGTSVAGTNSLSVNTIGDHMGWMIGATEITWPPVAVEEKTWSAVKELYKSR